MMFAGGQIGMIPSWQLSSDPRENININPFVKIPADWPDGQRTIQPIGAVSPRTYGDPLAATNGLGITMGRWGQPPAGLSGLETWAVANSKWLVVGGLALLGVAAVVGVGLVLR